MATRSKRAIGRRYIRGSHEDEHQAHQGQEREQHRRQMTASRRKHESYQDIGHKGGHRVAEENGSEYYCEIGHRGGQASAASHGREFYQDIRLLPKPALLGKIGNFSE